MKSRLIVAVAAATILVVASLSITENKAYAAARSTVVIVDNFSEQDLVRSSYSLDHGCWTKFAPEEIKHRGTWSAESCGPVTGVEGWVKYTVKGDPSKWVTFYFDN